jgi:hypothetical protein
MLTKFWYEVLKEKGNYGKCRLKLKDNIQMDLEEVLNEMWRQLAQERTTF